VFTRQNKQEAQKVGRGTEPVVTDSADDPKGGERRFFPWWMLAFLGFPLGGQLALAVVGPVEGALSGALGGALAGAVIGAAQWLALRPHLGVGASGRFSWARVRA
jgi:membrane associated rhomboid family serine protease